MFDPVRDITQLLRLVRTAYSPQCAYMGTCTPITDSVVVLPDCPNIRNHRQGLEPLTVKHYADIKS
jgi:hypothetical protein